MTASRFKKTIPICSPSMAFPTKTEWLKLWEDVQVICASDQDPDDGRMCDELAAAAVRMLISFDDITEE